MRPQTMRMWVPALVGRFDALPAQAGAADDTPDRPEPAPVDAAWLGWAVAPSVAFLAMWTLVNFVGATSESREPEARPAFTARTAPGPSEAAPTPPLTALSSLAASTEAPAQGREVVEAPPGALRVAGPTPTGQARARFTAANASGRGHLAIAAPSTGAGAMAAAINARAARLAESGRWREAQALYARSTRLAPSDPEGWFGVALSQRERGLRRPAMTSVQLALAANPTHPLSNLLTGVLHQEAGRNDQARRYYTRYLLVAEDGEYAPELRSVLAQLPQR